MTTGHGLRSAAASTRPSDRTANLAYQKPTGGSAAAFIGFMDTRLVDGDVPHGCRTRRRALRPRVSTCIARQPVVNVLAVAFIFRQASISLYFYRPLRILAQTFTAVEDRRDDTDRPAGRFDLGTVDVRFRAGSRRTRRHAERYQPFPLCLPAQYTRRCFGMDG